MFRDFISKSNFKTPIVAPADQRQKSQIALNCHTNEASSTVRAVVDMEAESIVGELDDISLYRPMKNTHRIIKTEKISVDILVIYNAFLEHLGKTIVTQ
jgi:hypothetical protein